MNIELWKAIDGFEGYEVSSAGGVRVADRIVPCGYDSVRTVKAKTLKPFVSRSTGYMQVSLAKRQRKSVHRLVAAAFCDGWFEGAVVNHKNGQRDDNRAENLEWVTMSENAKHSFRELGRITPTEGKFSAEHPTSKAVVATSLETGEQRFYACGMDAVREGFRSDCISRCCTGKIRHHKGFLWAFASSDVSTVPA